MTELGVVRVVFSAELETPDVGVLREHANDAGGVLVEPVEFTERTELPDVDLARYHLRCLDFTMTR